MTVPAGLKVALFATCFNDMMFPQAPKAVVKLLRRLGCEVDFPLEQTCCEQMFTNTGYADEAVPLVRRFVDVFAGYDAVDAPPAPVWARCEYSTESWRMTVGACVSRLRA